MLTLVSTAKPFRGHFGLIQRNAIRSWAMLHPKPEGLEQLSQANIHMIRLCGDPPLKRVFRIVLGGGKGRFVWVTGLVKPNNPNLLFHSCSPTTM